MDDLKRKGSCLCGSVSFEATLFTKEVHVCHCRICQKWAGGPAFAISVHDDWKIDGEDSVSWYASSAHAERGFCSKCGTHLFFRTKDGSYHGITGLIDDKDGLTIGEHIFVDAKPSYYDFTDDSPRLTEAEFLKKIGAA